VYRSLEPELRKMLGDGLFEEIADYLDARMVAPEPPVPHPAAVPVTLGRSRNGRRASRAASAARHG
jgi:hypothetical protein